MALGFSHSIRYDLIAVNRNKIPDINYRPADYGLIFGYSIYLDYHIKTFKNAELFIHLGKSRLNIGTEYIQTKSTKIADEIFYSYHDEDFAYFAWDFALGYKKNKTSFTIGAYTTSVVNYDFVNSFILPYFSFKYNFGKMF